MPVKDGFDTLTQLKNNEKLKDVNVVVLSNLGQSEDIEKAKRLGAAGYIIKKDLAIKDLFSEVSKYLEQPFWRCFSCSFRRMHWYRSFNTVVS